MGKVKEHFKRNKGVYIAAGVGIVASVAAGVVGYKMQCCKLDRWSNILDMSIEELSHKTNIEIEDHVVDKAVQRAAEREAHKTIAYATQGIVGEISKDIRYQVSRAVNTKYPDIAEAVSTEVAKQVSNIDIADLKKDISSKAKDAVLEKFNGNLDDLLEDFNDKLESTAKIYESIANAMTKTQEKETIFKISQ